MALLAGIVPETVALSVASFRRTAQVTVHPSYADEYFARHGKRAAA